MKTFYNKLITASLLIGAFIFLCGVGPCETGYTISGTVDGDVDSGVTITLSGNGTGTATTSSDGSYTLARLDNGAFTVTPSLDGYTFTPASASVSVFDADETGVDFTATEQGTGIEMVSISGGTFQMGCTPGDTECESNESPRHSVTISSFEIGKHEVTQRQWEEVMGSNPSYFDTCGDDCPVETVSWDDTQTFITTLNSQTGQSYRLCTEAEWEYAARAGTETKWYCGNDESCVNDIAWYWDNSGSIEWGTHPVGLKTPNAWGLYDMSGNMGEWVNDWYSTYPSGSVTNPTGPVSGSGRGGGWGYSARYCRSAYRDNYPSSDDYNLGFRLCR